MALWPNFLSCHPESSPYHQHPHFLAPVSQCLSLVYFPFRTPPPLWDHVPFSLRASLLFPINTRFEHQSWSLAICPLHFLNRRLSGQVLHHGPRTDGLQITRHGQNSASPSLICKKDLAAKAMSTQAGVQGWSQGRRATGDDDSGPCCFSPSRSSATRPVPGLAWFPSHRFEAASSPPDCFQQPHYQENIRRLVALSSVTMHAAARTSPSRDREEKFPTCDEL